MVRKNPIRRRSMMKMKPMTTAVPNAWIVSMSGHPSNDSPNIHCAYSEFSSHCSTVQPSLTIMASKYRPALMVDPLHAPVEKVQGDQCQAQDTGGDRDDHQ